VTRAVVRIVSATWAIAVLATACTSSPNEIDRLRKVANLDLCPKTTASSTQVPKLHFDCLGYGPGVTLGAVDDTPTLINVWGSWCEPCQKEVPILERGYRVAHGKLRILGVDSLDSHASALDFAAHAHMTYPSVTDDNGMFVRDLGTNATPITLFVTAGGTVAHTQRGAFASFDQLRAEVRRWLGVTV
jgi:cytochrome c biogenesis protein CcmG, thiol:disulfide interchange protein DsbE